MISKSEFMAKVDARLGTKGIVEVPEELLDQITGAGPGDFYENFKDCCVGGTDAPWFEQNFNDVWPWGDNDAPPNPTGGGTS